MIAKSDIIDIFCRSLRPGRRAERIRRQNRRESNEANCELNGRDAALKAVRVRACCDVTECDIGETMFSG